MHQERQQYGRRQAHNFCVKMKRVRLETETEALFNEDSDEYRLVQWGQYLDDLVAQISPVFAKWAQEPLKTYQEVDKDFRKETCHRQSMFYFIIQSEWSAPALSAPRISSCKKKVVRIEMGYKTFELFSKFSLSFAFNMMEKLRGTFESNDMYKVRDTISPITVFSRFTCNIEVTSKERYPFDKNKKMAL